MSTRTQSFEEWGHLIDPVFQWVIKSGKPETHRRQAQHGQTIWPDDPVINPLLHSKENMLIDLEQRWYFFYRVF